MIGEGERSGENGALSNNGALGERGRSTRRKKTPLYSGGTYPTVTPLSSPAQSGTTAREGRYYLRAVLPLPIQLYYRAEEKVRPLAPERYYRGSRSGTTASTTATTAAEPDTRKPRLESRQYQRGTGDVLPLMA